MIYNLISDSNSYKARLSALRKRGGIGQAILPNRIIHYYERRIPKAKSRNDPNNKYIANATHQTSRDTPLKIIGATVLTSLIVYGAALVIDDAIKKTNANEQRKYDNAAPLEKFRPQDTQFGDTTVTFNGYDTTAINNADFNIEPDQNGNDSIDSKLK